MDSRAPRCSQLLCHTGLDLRTVVCVCSRSCMEDEHIQKNKHLTVIIITITIFIIIKIIIIISIIIIFYYQQNIGDMET